jgi:hypothetical protein
MSPDARIGHRRICGVQGVADAALRSPVPLALELLANSSVSPNAHKRPIWLLTLIKAGLMSSRNS